MQVYWEKKLSQNCVLQFVLLYYLGLGWTSGCRCGFRRYPFDDGNQWSKIQSKTHFCGEVLSRAVQLSIGQLASDIQGKNKIQRETFILFIYLLAFQVLYSLISFGVPIRPDDPVTLDPPDHMLRIRLVCVMLDVCGPYFNSGSAKRKLDYFLTYFQVRCNTKYVIDWNINLLK